MTDDASDVSGPWSGIDEGAPESAPVDAGSRSGTASGNLTLALFNQTPGAIAVIGARGDYIHVNRAWEKICGADAGTLSGQPVGEAFPPWKGDWAERIDDCLEGIGGGRGGLEFRTGEGDWCRGDWELSAISFNGEGDGGGAPDAALLVFMDRTAAVKRESALRARIDEYQQYETGDNASALEVTGRLTEARDAAQAANRSKSQFFANISHELRSPLNAIIGFSEILQKELFGPIGQPQYREYVHDIQDSAEHLLEIINDILDLSKIEAGKFDLAEVDVNLLELIESCSRIVAHKAAQGEIELRVDVPQTLPVLYADQRKVKQILINLLSNAVKFTPGGGVITTRVTVEDDGAIVLSVTDTGIGIAPEDIECVFDVFGQVDSDLDKAAAGTGLGLPLSRSLAEMHGAVLELDSAPGLGTTATVRFPPERSLNGEVRARDPHPGEFDISRDAETHFLNAVER